MSDQPTTQLVDKEGSIGALAGRSSGKPLPLKIAHHRHQAAVQVSADPTR